MCHRAKGVPIIQFGVPTYLKRVPIFQLRPPKGVSIFQLFFKIIFQLFSTYGNFKNIFAILENLSRETKNLNLGIFKISLRKNLLKSLTSFSMEHVGLTD